MTTDTETSIQTIDKQIKKYIILDVPANIILGLGAYSLITGEGANIHSLLANNIVVYSLVAVGAVLTLWAGINIFKLGRKKKALQTNNDSVAFKMMGD
ncbi:hypothetical protein CW740_04930 [Kangiella profundi]|uniref:Uncharacterized protein n=1 Tax=Kangiella profundi TaxID=1561924 RepID=A0A2K9A7C6_9GAMM|nr:hypothetical protein [Kangiella profundi]AUD78630.1 hypothetical protein CW740_04930 [Kangiella profundi]GGF09580.1 hypothetical protein GCM10011356_23800 [Kangiella profundi]